MVHRNSQASRPLIDSTSQQELPAIASLPVSVNESKQAAPQQVLSEASAPLTNQIVDQGEPITGLSESLAAEPLPQKKITESHEGKVNEESKKEDAVAIARYSEAELIIPKPFTADMFQKDNSVRDGSYDQAHGLSRDCR